jgi:MFS family permease
MAWGWLRVIETIGDLVDVGRKVRRASSAVRGDGGEIQRTEPQGVTSALGQMETRLTGVLIGALQEAFDRDRARLDLERERVDDERRRAQEALRLEAERQAAERALTERRLTMIAALALWITSAAVAAFLPGMRATVARVPLGLGWASIIGAIALATASRGPLAQGFLLAGFALIALAIVLAL